MAYNKIQDNKSSLKIGGLKLVKSNNSEISKKLASSSSKNTSSHRTSVTSTVEAQNQENINCNSPSAGIQVSPKVSFSTAPEEEYITSSRYTADPLPTIPPRRSETGTSATSNLVKSKSMVLPTSDRYITVSSIPQRTSVFGQTTSSGCPVADTRSELPALPDRPHKQSTTPIPDNNPQFNVEVPGLPERVYKRTSSAPLGSDRRSAQSCCRMIEVPQKNGSVKKYRPLPLPPPSSTNPPDKPRKTALLELFCSYAVDETN